MLKYIRKYGTADKRKGNKMSYYIIELESEQGTHFTVRKVFSSIAKAEAYRKKCAYISTGDKMEAVTRSAIVKVEMV